MSDQELTAYKDGEKWGFRRTDGEVVITATFDAVGSFSEGFARFRNGSSWGFLDTAGTVAIRPRFEQARHFTGGYAKVKLDGKWCMVDSEGFVVEDLDLRTSYLDNEGQFISDQEHTAWEKPPRAADETEGE